ncbi:MAG: T9SS type A sorting domain-containing protein [Bacteroidales bacterium]|nr:T9SS type A sorting domain-containing protein [Bacteroidales bacterium]
MKTKILLLGIALLTFSMFVKAQYFTVNINQPQVLSANAGENTSITHGESIVLGSSPTAEFGYGDYVYTWYPTTWLDDANSPNPTATPEDTITYTLTVSDLKNCIAEDQITIFVLSSDINPERFDEKVKIYPNPNNGKFVVSVETAKGVIDISVYDVIGNLVYQEDGNNTTHFYRSIDISNQPAGQYIIRLTTVEGVFTGKTIIQ